ncbi:MAG: hypothetical protein ACOC6P_01795 [Candidatus Aminicenantaceae bacterium]
MFGCLFILPEERIIRKEGEEEKKSLVRKELLYEKKKGIEKTVRNIFIPYRLWKENVEEEQIRNRPAAEKKREEVESKKSDPSFGLEYIGYIESGERIVAIIFLEGKAFAVKKGEMLAENIEITSITREEIEIKGPDEEKKKFSRQGE